MVADDGGRYAYDQQADVCRWNLAKLAESLSPLVSSERMTQILDATYDVTYARSYTDIMRRKVRLPYLVEFVTRVNLYFQLRECSCIMILFFSSDYWTNRNGEFHSNYW